MVLADKLPVHGSKLAVGTANSVTGFYAFSRMNAGDQVVLKPGPVVGVNEGDKSSSDRLLLRPPKLLQPSIIDATNQALPVCDTAGLRIEAE